MPKASSKSRMSPPGSRKAREDESDRERWALVSFIMKAVNLGRKKL